jgi:hypothetical protein
MGIWREMDGMRPIRGGNGGKKEKEMEITPFVVDSHGPSTFLLQPTPPLAPCGLGAA